MARSSRRSLFLVLSLLLLCGCMGAVFGQRTAAVEGSSDSEIRTNIGEFTRIYDLVEQNYAEPVNPDKAIYNGAIPGMLRVLDPHSNFFDPKQYALLREDQQGKYYGVGMTVGERNNRVIVMAPFLGTPAYRAGLRPGHVYSIVFAERLLRRTPRQRSQPVAVEIGQDGVEPAAHVAAVEQMLCAQRPHQRVLDQIVGKLGIARERTGVASERRNCSGNSRAKPAHRGRHFSALRFCSPCIVDASFPPPAAAPHCGGTFIPTNTFHPVDIPLRVRRTG